MLGFIIWGMRMETLDKNLKFLKLPVLLDLYKKEAEESLKTGESYESFLSRLIEQEVLGRQNRQMQTRIKNASFPFFKTLDNFDFNAISGIDKKYLLDLSKGKFLESKENILILGNSGTGKTHLATALGIAICYMGKSVLFQRASHLVQTLMEAHGEKKYLALKNRLKAYKLLIIDELGYIPFSKIGSELLFEIFAERYEQGSVVITTNLPFEEWTQVFGCKRLTGALLDRLTHHAHILTMNGDSYRVTHRTKGNT